MKTFEWRNERGVDKVILTFDVEDFINSMSLMALLRLLRLLEKYDLKALFFITGNMAEKLHSYPEILALLEAHEIGYHSSSHSVRPIIAEYTDLKSYAKARRVSMKRETAHINPVTGEIEGKGGLVFLRELFPNKDIVSFRAPGHCWFPPHLEALRALGIRFDFSADIYPMPVYYKGITFYPSPIALDGAVPYRGFLSSFPRNKVVVFMSHPNFFVNSEFWSSIYWHGNPEKLSTVSPRSRTETVCLFMGFELLLKWLSLLQKIDLIKVEPHPAESRTNLTPTSENVIKCYERSIEWSKNFSNFKPKFLRAHFFKFFDIDEAEEPYA